MDTKGFSVFILDVDEKSNLLLDVEPVHMKIDTERLSCIDP